MGQWKQRNEDIMKWLKDGNVSTIVFVGDTGMGKSFMAREISECTINKGLCYATLWIYVTKNYDFNLFYKDIDRQLSLSSVTEELEYAESKTVLNLKPHEFVQWGHKKEKTDQEEETTEKLNEGIQEKLKEIGKTLALENKYLLLVLDEGGNNLIFNSNLLVKQQDWMSQFCDCLRNRLKIIITTKNLGDLRDTQTRKVIKFPPLNVDDSVSLLQMRVDERVSVNQSFQPLAHAIAEKSEGKPAAIFVIAKTLNYIVKHNSDELQRAIIKAAYYEKTSHTNPLFFCACDMIKTNATKNCFWHSIYLLNSYGRIHFNELITHWIMEGYFDPFNQIEEAYWKGHEVLTELKNRALLKIQGNNIVAVEGELLKMIDSCPLKTGLLRLFSVLKDDEILGTVTRMDGMIKTLCNPRFLDKNCTLLIDGSHISREVHQSLFDSMKELKVLAVFKARCESLIPSLYKMDKLFVLVLRTCDLGAEVAHINRLKTLKVLEITGDSQLLSLPNKLFEGMADLRSLNLSGLQIKSLPSLSNLHELRSLILRQLSCLEEMPSLEELVKLEVLDLSGAESLKSMRSNLFDELTNLQSLNLSGLQIESLPSFSELHKLRALILQGCSRVKKLECLRGLDELQVLDISGATSFESFGDPTLSVLPKVQTIDLSSTKIRTLPEFDKELKELTKVFLSGCRNLSSLPKLQLLPSLQILDLSGASMFKTFQDQSLENLQQLRILDLSRTSVKKAPRIPRDLLELNLMGCRELEELPPNVCEEQLQTTDKGWVSPRQLD